MNWPRRVGALVRRVWRSTTVEPVLFAVIFSLSLSMTVIQDLILYKTCLTMDDLPEVICRHLNGKNVKNSSEIVEAKAAIFNIYFSISGALPSVVFAAFLGPWSDRHGRKPPMILSTFGYVLLYTGLTVISCFPSSSIFWLLVLQVVQGAFGGFIALLMSSFSYISDASTVSSRTIRMSVVSAVCYAAAPPGMYLGGYLFEHAGGYLPVFALSVALSILASLYVIFHIEETIRPSAETQETRWKFFDLKHLDQLWEAIRKSRPQRTRGKLLFLIFTMAWMSAISGGVSAVEYPYVLMKFGWDVQDYNTFTGISTVMKLLGSLLVLPFFAKFLKLPDGLIGIVGLYSLTSGYVVCGLAAHGETLFFGTCLAMLSMHSFVAARSLVSKLVAPDEVGRFFAVIATGESAFPILLTPLYNAFYEATLRTSLSNSFFFLGSILLVPCFIPFLWILFAHRFDDTESERAVLVNAEFVNENQSTTESPAEEQLVS
ncbi:unnamed protein product [Cyprideis torosa]|uniref:Uncharacterized protein n=1 Tax=Cyprideis torosa TaxID=163714 RepID=A0A7R8WD95_9CRUS|nr:unnamed protein product [Cyprideis torosa]CAG0894335.1 unnamed protein product [Cyprideis torosa]